MVKGSVALKESEYHVKIKGELKVPAQKAVLEPHALATSEKTRRGVVDTHGAYNLRPPSIGFEPNGLIQDGI